MSGHLPYGPIILCGGACHPNKHPCQAACLHCRVHLKHNLEQINTCMSVIHHPQHAVANRPAIVTNRLLRHLPIVGIGACKERQDHVWEECRPVQQSPCQQVRLAASPLLVRLARHGQQLINSISPTYLPCRMSSMVHQDFLNLDPQIIAPSILQNSQYQDIFFHADLDEGRLTLS